MATSSDDTFDLLLREAGFVENGRSSTGLFSAATINELLTADLRYGDLFDKSVDQLKAVDLVYEVPSQVDDVPGITSIYFKVLDQPNPQLEMELRELVWNQGRSPTLWIITPATIRIYDSFARPNEEDDSDSHLLAELSCINNRVHGIAAFHKSLFDSGEFWLGDYGRKIARSERVDNAMLEDLSQAEKLLILYGLPVAIAHALLGRTIFVSYLVDRGILKPTYFQDNYSQASFANLLSNKAATYNFFDWLCQTFNGDLFPIEPEEYELVNENYLGIIQMLLSGSDLTSYPFVQTRLWPYKFDVIPIELISSIYEMFAHSRNFEEAEARSIHYTRFQLVELVLSIAMSGLHHSAVVLDPACGSGVFLVEAFRRLSRMRARELGRVLQRDELQEILRYQIFGIDLDKDAVHIAAFSLYLTLLELDPDPQPPEALRFPPLVYGDGFNEERPPNLYIQDYCNTAHPFNQLHPFGDKAIDLIVGNPPWTALEKSTAPRDPDFPINGRKWGYEYCIKNSVPDKKPDLAFMTRSRSFANEHTKIAFIVCSRLFYQQGDLPYEQRWLNIFMRFHTLDTVINFSDFVGENVLFGGRSSTRLPASAVFYRALPPNLNSNVTYIAPKWYPAIKQQNEIAISQSDIHRLSQAALREEPVLWKTAFRGTPRDFILLRRLQTLPTLREVLLNVGIQQPTSMSYGLTFGKGSRKDASILEGTPYLPSKISSRYGINVSELPLFDFLYVAEKSNRPKLKLPVIILFRSLLNNRARTAILESTSERSHLTFDHMYYGISFANAPWLAYRINALLNSKLVFYLLFMSSSSLGWDRRLVEPLDWFQVRLPSFVLDEASSSIWEDLLYQENKLRSIWKFNARGEVASAVTQAENELNQIVYQLYGLSDQEITLVEDTFSYTIEPFLERTQNGALSYSTKPSSEDLELYAMRLCGQLNGLLKYAGLELGATTLTFGPQSLLAACRFSQYPLGEGSHIKHVRLSNVENMMEQLSEDLRGDLVDHLYSQRDLHVYQGESFWIIKKAEKRQWSEASALNDADSVLREHMEAAAHG